MPESLQNYFTQESLLKFHTLYELYYQISLWEYIYALEQDSQKTYDKIVTFHLEVDPDQALSNMFDIFVDHSNDGDFDKKFFYYH